MERCKPATLELFQRGPMIKLLGEPSIVVDPAARIEEWSWYGGKYKGPKKDGKAQGICRRIAGSNIALVQFNGDKKHGLTIVWGDFGTIEVVLWKKNKELGSILWDTNDWTELRSKNKEVFDGVLSIDDFRR